MHIAADCFREVLRECGVPEENADLARGAFICLKMTQADDVRDRLMRIASQVSIDQNSLPILSQSYSSEQELEKGQVRFKMNSKLDKKSSASMQVMPRTNI